MGWFLGLDTSNYTTSIALYHSDTGEVKMRKKLLPVKDQSCGLRQSDAVFLHVKQLGNLAADLMENEQISVDAIGVSQYPRNAEGSYMPCFLVGSMVAQTLGSFLKVPVFSFSHQQGHIAAALYSAGCLDWLASKERSGTFYAFHVSGGTTEALEVTGRGHQMDIRLLTHTLDLNAGQAIDRVGVMMGLSFPCGKQLEQLALKNQEKVSVRRPKLKDGNCCLSGLENQCAALLSQGKSKEYVAAFCLETVKRTVAEMTRYLLEQYGEKPVLYAGGVMSNSLIRAFLESRYQGRFASPEYSADNSAGIAVLASMAYEE
ncbi:MAG: peptidase M22 [Massiliimalia sp.]|jgi:N6-L-threonylcarbamoyladenine synthase